MAIKIASPVSDMIKLIDLLEIVQNGSFGPIRHGAYLDEFANIVGPPDHWYFAPSDKDTFCVMRFGVVEAHFRSDGGRMVLKYAEINIHALRKGNHPFSRDQYDNQIRIVVPDRKLMEYRHIEPLLNNIGISFSKDIDEPVSQDTVAAMIFKNGIRFYFSGHRLPILSVIALS